MGIYISGVKGLPEQVQENKEKIATIEEEIEGIDWDAIHNLENQVAENTQDINNMEGTIGTQNIAITQLGGRVDDLEDKTQDITRQGSTLYIDTNEVVLNADLGFEADSGSDIKLNNEANTPNKIVSAQDSNNFIDFDSSNCLHIMSDGGEYEFRDDAIYVNSTPIGGGSTLYQHLLVLEIASSYVSLPIIRDTATTFTLATFKTFLNDNGFNSTANTYPVNEYIYNGTNRISIDGIYYNNNSVYAVIYNWDTSQTSNTYSVSISREKVIQIA